MYRVSSFLFEQAIYIYVFPVNFLGVLLFLSRIHVPLDCLAEHFDEGVLVLLRLRFDLLLYYVNIRLQHSIPSSSVFVEDKCCFALYILHSTVKCFRAALFSVDAIGYLQKLFQIEIWHAQRRLQFSGDCILFHQESLQVEMDRELIARTDLHIFILEGVEQAWNALFVLLEVLQHG